TLAPYLLSRIIDPLSQSLPELSFLLHEFQTDGLTKRLDRGQLDLLILPWKPEMECFDRIDLFNEPLQLAAPRNHPILKKKQLTLDSLEGEHVLTLEDGHCLRDDVLDVCFSAGANEDHRFQATSLETLRFMVASGLGITLIPELAVDNNKNLSYRKFSMPEPQRMVSMVMRKGYSRVLCAQVISKIIKSSVNDLVH
ncbi:MAG: LysR substrate-binding domain-containing protein, partial [bacterium]